MTDTSAKSFAKSLHDLGIKHRTDKATHHRFLDFYQARIGQPETILEFGIRDGASLKMWRDFFPKAKVTGWDIAQVMGIVGVVTQVVDCTKALPGDAKYDLIIDDASHRTLDQVQTFNNWFSAVSPGGCYIVEDVHSQYFTEYNPTGFDLDAWVKSLGLMYEYFWRDPNDKSDSGTLIIYKR